MLNITPTQVGAGATVKVLDTTIPAGEHWEVCRLDLRRDVAEVALNHTIYVTPAGGTRRPVGLPLTTVRDWTLENPHIHLDAGDRIEVEITNTHTAAVNVTPDVQIDKAVGGGGGGGIMQVRNAAGALIDVGYRAADQLVPVRTPGLATYYAYADAVVPAGAKQHLSILNGIGSARVVKIRKLFCSNLALAAVTGAALRFDVKRATAHSVGTLLTAQTADTANPPLPAAITVRTGATVVEGALLYPFVTNSDEVGATNAFPTATLQQLLSLAVESPEIQELTLREGEGMTVKQITSSTVGSFGWLLVFTVEA